MADFDLVIVGGGIGGGALAAVMARAGRSVLLLEASEAYEDKVRGEWISPWGVAETKRLDLYDTLMAAGGHHLTKHVGYGPGVDPAEAEKLAMDLGMFVPDVPGPLCIGHPHHCQTLFDAAGKAGADARRGVTVHEVTLGSAPSIRFSDASGEHSHTARLVVGADGRMSMVRKTAGITLHRDEPHHWFAGLLVEGADDWDELAQATGTEGDFHFLAFPQGDGRVRIYGGYPIEEAKRFAGPEGARRFLDAFAFESSPRNRAIVEAEPAGPLLSYHNSDAWTDEPYGEGFVLVGDAAGWNDPILGLGLSITYRDVRMVSDILLASDDWSADLFRPYGEERYERLRRLRFAAKVLSALEVEFGAEAEARRADFDRRAAADPSLRMYGLATLGGPELVPEDYFTEESFARILGLQEAA
jgi:2-polyprenyl-6-methoxyphenol hydroxylase-like FAD-dependent oxidoreductase